MKMEKLLINHLRLVVEAEVLVSLYCATQAAIISYTQSASMTLAKYNINVNTIAPDVINIPIWKKVDALFTKYEHRPSGKKIWLVRLSPWDEWDYQKILWEQPYFWHLMTQIIYLARH